MSSVDQVRNLRSLRSRSTPAPASMKETKKALLPFEQIGHGFQIRKRADAARVFTMPMFHNTADKRPN